MVVAIHITDLAGNPLPAGDPATDQVYTLDNTPPTVDSSERADADPTSAGSVDFTVTFSEPVSGVDTSDFTLMTTGGISGTSVTGVSPSSGFSTVYTVTVGTGSGDGTIRLDVSDDDTIQDGVSNPLDGAYTGGEAYTVDKNDAPTDLDLSPTSVADNEPVGTVVGNFSTTDPDAGDTHTYSLVSGAGDTENSSFQILANELRTAAVFDYEIQSSYSIRVQTDDGHGGTYEEAFTITVTVHPGLSLEEGVVSGVGNSGWTTVTLDHSYASMVVVASPNYTETSVPLVTRVRNAGGNSFEVRVDRTDGLAAAVSPVNVHYLVVEEGVYNVDDHGVKMEAVRFTSTVTDYKNSWVGESRSYNNAYTDPVVVGQVLSYNDADFSTFWSRGANYKSPASSTALGVGKHVGEDTDTTRADETIGYIVIEAGSGTLDGVVYVAGVGADSVEGITESVPYTYPLSGLSSVSSGIVSQTAMDGVDGGWAVLYGPSPITSASLRLAIDEDQAGDSERAHTTEQVAYLVFEAPAESSGADFVRQVNGIEKAGAHDAVLRQAVEWTSRTPDDSLDELFIWLTGFEHVSENGDPSKKDIRSPLDFYVQFEAP